MATEETSAEPSTDDLSKPLGKKKPKRKAFVVPPWIVSRSIAGVLGFCVLVLAGWILFIDEPYGGEPMTIVSADTRASPQSGKPGEGAKPGETAKPGTPSADGKEKPGDGQTVTIIDGSTGKRQEVTVTPPGANPKPDSKVGPRPDKRSDAIIDQRLIETSRHGGIPKIAADGARPADIYAKPIKPQGGKVEGPRVAIVLEGLGIGANATAEALAKLPPEVTFAFSPYGVDIERWVNRARSESHEVLLQV